MSSDSHGHTVAAWTAVAIIIGGTLISAVALPLRSTVLFFIGVGVIVLGAIAGKVMSMMGLGQTISYKDERDPDYDDDDQSDDAGDGRTDGDVGEPRESLSDERTDVPARPEPA